MTARNKLYVLTGVFILALLMSQTPFAQNLVVDPDKKGSIYIHKYAVDSLEDYETPDTGSEQNVSGLKPIPNIEFTVVRVADDTTDPANADAIAGAEAYARTIETDAAGNAVFSELAHGIYLVREEKNAAVDRPVDNFLVSIPMTSPTGNGWLYDVHVYPKNQLIALPDFDKSVHEPGIRSTSVGLGERVNWFIDAGIPRDIETAVLYKVVCDLNDYLVYAENSISMQAKSGEETIWLTGGEDFSFSQSENQLDLELLENGKKKLGRLINEEAAQTPVLSVSYGTVLDIPLASFPDIAGKDIATTASFFYTNALNIEYTASVSEENSPSVYTGGLNITKIDGKNENTLSGASFKLFRTLDDARTGSDPLQIPNNGGDWVATSNEEGKAYFYGIPYGQPGESAAEGSTTYYLVETQAPEGYNLLKAPVEVTVDAGSHLDGNAVLVRDYSGFTLPVTGGMGTYLFIIGGIVLIAAGCFILFQSRKDKQK